jgi:uncharacterized protein YjaZ
MLPTPPAIEVHIPDRAPGFDWAEIERIARSTHARAAERMRLDPVKVTIGVTRHPGAREYGIYARAHGARDVRIALVPGHPHVMARLPLALAHELAHCARMRLGYHTNALAEVVAFEGLADHVAVELCGGPPGPWSHSRTPRELARLLRRARATGWTKPVDPDAWQLGSRPQRLRRWAAYALGWEMVRRYLARHPGKRASQLAGTSSMVLLRGAGW